MQLFYASQEDFTNGHLSEGESRHCATVLRKKIGDEILLMDGLGNVVVSEIEDLSGKKVWFNVKEKISQNAVLPKLHIAIALTKSMDRFEFFVEKACELGIQEITPMHTYNSERRKFNEEKLNKWMIAACKQSQTYIFPKINPLKKYSEVVKLQAEQRFIAHCHSHETPQLEDLAGENECLLLIGPEGDFSAQEIKEAEENGFEAVSLGNKRLRTETAGMFACSIFNLKGKNV